MMFMEYIIRSLATMASLPSSSSNNISKYFENITKTYFKGESLLFIYWTNVSVELRHDLINYWVKSEIVTVETCNCDYVSDDIIWERSYVKNTVVLLGDLVPERRHIDNIRQCLSWNARSKILAIVTHKKINITLEKIWAHTKALNVTIMSLMSSVKYYTLYPYQNFKIIEAAQDKLFPAKSLDDLHGSVVIVAATHSEPYVFAPNSKNIYPDGLEIRMMGAISQHHNFRLKYIKPSNGENPWLVTSSDNRKTAGNFRLLESNEADLLFHGVQIRFDRCSIADMTSVHTFDSLVWVVPLHVFSFGWKSVFIIFQNELWAMLMITLVLIAGTLYLITKSGSSSIVYRPSDAFFQTIGIFLSVPIHFYKRGQLYRLFLFGISYYIMVISATYQSSLITYLTMPASGKQYETISDAVDDGLIGYLFPSGKATYNITNHDLWNKILSPGRHVWSDDSATILRIIAYNKTIYTQIMKNVVNFEVHKNLLDSDHKSMVHVLSETLPYMASIFTSKGHPLTDVIKKQILRFFDMGIIDHWMRDILLKNFKIQRDAETSHGKGPVALSAEHLRGAFYIIPFFTSIATVIFIYEVVCKWWGNKKLKRARKACREEYEKLKFFVRVKDNFR